MLSDLGITRIVIAHRAETLRAADTIYTLHDGVLVREASASKNDDGVYGRPPVTKEHGSFLEDEIED